MFTTPVTPKPYATKISYNSNLFFTGSCFAESIGEKFCKAKFRANVNPFGILYNPVSISYALERIISGIPYKPEDLIFHEGLYHSPDHHGCFSGSDRDKVLSEINNSLATAKEDLTKTTHLFITLGSADVYRFNETGKIAGNCHKMPGNMFTKERLSLTEIISCLEQAISAITSLNPAIKIIFTVSPVRYMQDGAHSGQINKALLLLATESICEKFPGSTEYFPAYEIVMDELRDYRFYAEDMIHPSPVTVEYIYRKALESMADKRALDIIPQIEKIHAARNHRFLHPSPESIRKFAETQLIAIANIEKAMNLFIPDFEDEKNYFRCISNI